MADLVNSLLVEQIENYDSYLTEKNQAIRQNDYNITRLGLNSNRYNLYKKSW